MTSIAVLNDLENEALEAELGSMRIKAELISLGRDKKRAVCKTMLDARREIRRRNVVVMESMTTELFEMAIKGFMIRSADAGIGVGLG